MYVTGNSKETVDIIALLQGRILLLIGDRKYPELSARVQSRKQTEHCWQNGHDHAWGSLGEGENGGDSEIARDRE